MNRLRSTIFERGPYISFANCGLPYHIAGEIEDRSKLLVMTPEKMWTRSHVAVHVNHEVFRSIDRPRQSVCEIMTGPEQDFRYDKLILSQGATPIVPPISGADLPNVFTLRDVPDMDRILAFARFAQAEDGGDHWRWVHWPRNGRGLSSPRHRGYSDREASAHTPSARPRYRHCISRTVFAADNFAVMTGAEAKSFQRTRAWNCQWPIRSGGVDPAQCGRSRRSRLGQTRRT